MGYYIKEGEMSSKANESKEIKYTAKEITENTLLMTYIKQTLKGWFK